VEKARILIVEDERVVALDLRRMPRGWGYTDVDVATSGPEAVEKAAKFKPDLVLMDIVLGGRADGIEAAERIQRARPIPVIFITAHGDDANSYRALEALPVGMIRVITKPVKEEDLKSAIEIAVRD